MSPGATAWRLFLTCWIVFALHFATDVVREHYPAVALGDDFTFRLDPYAGLHPDMFEKPGYGWHIGNNPGVSLLAAIPYALLRPVTDRVVERVQAGRAARGETEPPEFDTPRGNARNFFAEAWRRGFDIKLGLVAFITQFFLMAPSSAAAAVLIFYALRWTLRDDRTALWLALLYAFGTPVFFRTGFLNHNLMLGHIAFAGFLALWAPEGETLRLSERTRYVLAGLAGGTAILFDYSGVVFLLGLFAYALARSWIGERQPGRSVSLGLFYVLGTLPPVLMLWFYQWKAFGNPFYPGQHWMPPVEYIDRGYQGYSAPQISLLAALAFDPRFGLFTSGPVLLLAAAAPFLRRGKERALPAIELAACLGLFLALWVFFAGNNYTRLQWNTGVRYMAAGIPFLFLPAAIVLARMPAAAFRAIALLSVALCWPMAMNREVWRPLGVLDPLVRVLAGGFELPALTTIGRMHAFDTFIPDGVSPIPLFVLAGVVIALLWGRRTRERS